MICAIHQPNYFPYPGFFDKALKSDIFIIYDTTQFRKNNYQNRNRICNTKGWQWITIPIVHRFGQKISEVEIKNPAKALKNNWTAIQTIYGKAPYFKLYSEIFENIFRKEYLNIAELNCDLIYAVAGILGIKTKFVRSSALPEINSVRTQALIDLCKEVNCKTYLSGITGENYLKKELFLSSGIKLKFQKFTQPEYKQFNNPEFQPHMSIIDMLFNCGESTIKMLGEKEN